MYQTISLFAKQFGLSRATLLYYDRIGLLKPAGINPSGYRLYGKNEKLRMESINTFRKAGLSLKEIQDILDTENSDYSLETALKNRLQLLNNEIHDLRLQQQLITRLLTHDKDVPRYRNLSVDQWVAMLEEVGVDEKGRELWHKTFERDAPEEHQAFLSFLGLDEKEIDTIRKNSR